jgi:hypothetical protein
VTKSAYFKIQDLVHPDIYRDRGDKAWQLLNPVGLITLDALYQKFGPFVINTWNNPDLQKTYGIRRSSGLRKFDDIGAKYSMHKFGGAYDCVGFKNHTPKQVREYILANKDEFPYITAVENVDGWLHFDCRNCDPITVFNP